MSTEQNKALVRRNFEMYDRGDLDAQVALYAPEARIYLPELMNREGFKQLLSVFAAAFRDSHHTIDDQIAEGDKVVTHWTWHGTHAGNFQGIPPSGKKVTMIGITIDRIADGKIVERWGVYDALGLMQQLAVVPAPEVA